ncbi:MAG: helix-turn-helix domain-containing protein [Deltaproteobacteria bacterium]|nr:helix-turn-helix domain-containing protein [Deltaproteobacteria bacterium]
MASRKIQRLASIVGGNISRRRRQMGITQAELAERLGVGGDSLSRIEKGVVAPRFQRLEEIASALDCAVAELFRKEGEPLVVRLGTVEDMLRPLPPYAQEDIVRLMLDLARVIEKRLQGI